MWAVAALCHDVGYPVAAVERINERSRSTLQRLGLVPAGELRFAFSQQVLPFHDAMIRLMASKPVRACKRRGYLTHVQSKYYLKLLKSFDDLSHGVVSALLISKALVYFLESDMTFDDWKALSAEDARQFLVRRDILRAIAGHTCPDIYHLRFDTLSFLLFIVDELQCWGRPTLAELQGGPRGLTPVSAAVKEFSPEQIRIHVQTNDRSWVLSGQRYGHDYKDLAPLEGARHQIDKLHRIVRLAVGTPDLVARGQRLCLEYQIRNRSRSDRPALFLLKNGDITKEPKEWFNGPDTRS